MSGRLVSVCVLSLSFSFLASSAVAQNRGTERFQLALGLIQRGMHDDAARQLRRFVADNPRHAKAAEAYYRLGSCYLELKDKKKAIGALRDALAADTAADAGADAGADARGGKFRNRAEARYRLGLALAETGGLMEAAEQFRGLVAEQGEGHYLAAPSLYERGEALRKAGQDRPALVAYQRAAKLDKDKTGRFAVSSLYQAGFIQLRAKQYAAAERLFRSAADRFPKHAAYGECRFLQGEAALRDGRTDAARKAFERAVIAGGDYADDAAMGLGYCAVKAKQPQAAVQHFRSVVQRFSKSPLASKALLEAGRVLYHNKQYEPAVQVLGELLGRGGLVAEVQWPALEMRALCALDLSRPKSAARDLHAAIKLASGATDKARMYYSLGEAYADSKDWKNALAAYGRCQSMTKDKSLLGDALYGQCLALHRLKRYQESNDLVREFQKNHRDHRLSMTANFALAENYFALKDYAKADQSYAKVPSDHELAGKAAFKGAWCSYLAGDFKKAAQRFVIVAKFDKAEHAVIAEEALSMEALAWLESGNLVPALKAADRYRDMNPEGSFLARTERVAARVLKRQGKLKLAASRLSRAASVEKSSDRAHGDKLEYAEVLFKQGNYAGAKQAYEPLTARSDKVGARAHEGMAWCAFELGDDDECGQWIDRGLEHKAGGAGRAGLLELLSALHHRRKDWSEAEKAAQRFLTEFDRHPRAAEMRYSLGVAQARCGKHKEARRALESLRDSKIARIDRVYYELAWVCRRSKDEKAALDAFRKVASLSKDANLAGEACLHVGEALLDTKQTEEALKWLVRVKGKYTARAQYLCGFARFEKKQYDRAVPHFNQIIAIGPKGVLYVEGQFFAGECLFRQNKHGAASKHYAVVLAKGPNHPRAQVARLHHGQSLVLSNQPKQAGAVLREFLRLAEKDVAKSDLARANLWLGRAWQQDKEHRRAEAAFAKVTDLTDSDLAAEAQFRIGECRVARRQLRDAVDAFVKLSILYAHPTWVQRGLNAAGDCYLQLKMPKKAAKLFQELVQKFPKSSLATSAQTKLKNIRSM